ncbi:maleylpyruvate isomerase family mycothiol-dependent enzyme [Geodermatophilus sp. CPCC 206100]
MDRGRPGATPRAIHRWAAATARSAPDAALPDDDPFVAAATVAGYPDAAADLRAALADPDRPCPTLTGPGVAGWWTRRQLHETLVHRLDLAEALGAPAEADPAVAADCVAEVLDTMQPRQVRLGRMAQPDTAVRLTTPAGTATLGRGPVVAEVSGPAPVVALLLWRRTTPEDPRLTVTGDRAAAADLLARPITP